MRALEVLESNWLGHGTRPSRLYPHQWSWDSACIAMGYASWNQAASGDRAPLALRRSVGERPGPAHRLHRGRRTLLPGSRVLAGRAFAGRPLGRQDLGIAQPPLHATAALRLFRQARDRDRGIAFLAELAPKLRAWHAYLYRERTRDGGGLVEIWHPWESGMDNSPLWDEALARIELTADQVPEYRRVDVELANPAERPTDEEYDRYVYLVGLFRDLDYRADRIQEATPFALQSVLFNSLLVQANLDLARDRARSSARIPASTRHWAQLTAVDLDARLWSEPDALYVDYDLQSGKHVAARTAAGLAPLYAGVPSPERARRMVERLAGSRVEVNASGWAVTSLSPGDPGYLPTRYWRGPIWPILNWVLQRGLDRYGFTTLASEVRRALIDLAGAERLLGALRCCYRRGAGGRKLRMDRRARARHPFHRDGVRGGRSTPWRTLRSRLPWTAVPHRATNGGSEMSDERNDSFGLEEPFDRRTLLGKAAVAGGVLAAGGLLTAGRASAGPRGGRRRRHRLLRPVRSDRRAGGNPEVRLQRLQRGRRRSLRADHRSEPLRRSRPGGGKGREGLDRRSRRPPRRLRDLPERGPHSRRRRRCKADQRAAGAVGQAREARHQDPVLHPALPGDLRDGRQQGRAQVHAQGSQHRRAHVRAAVPVGQDHPPAHGTEQIRAARQRDRPDAPVPPGLPRPVVHRHLRHGVPVEGGSTGVGVHAPALAVHPSAVPVVRVHAGPAAQPGGAARLGPRRAVEDGARPAPRRPRRIPGPERPEGPVVHAGPRRARHSERTRRIPRARRS